MKSLSDKSAYKLQKILYRRFGRELTRPELEEAYIRLIDFAQALVELYSTSSIQMPKSNNNTNSSNKHLHS